MQERLCSWISNTGHVAGQLLGIQQKHGQQAQNWLWHRGLCANLKVSLLADALLLRLLSALLGILLKLRSVPPGAGEGCEPSVCLRCF